MNVRKKKTVLCIEDNAVNVYLVQAIFESRRDVKLLTATHGKIGLELAKQHQPDLILLDLNLPDMRGEEFLKQLRTIEIGATVPVVIVSGEAMSADLVPLLKLGIVEYIMKPFDLSQFEQMVDRYLGARTGEK